MIELRKNGSIFDCEVQAIVNPVNCVGAMGKGLALEFKNRYPDMNTAYVQRCKRGEMKPGKVWMWHEHEKPCGEEPCRYVVNFPTKDHWKNPSHLSWIVDGLDDLKKHATLVNIASIALPALGCGLGGLDFDKVMPLVEDKLGHLQQVILFLPK